MRDRKLRAWHKRYKRMYKVIDLHLNEFEGNWATVEGFSVPEDKGIHIQIQPKDCVIMDFTGLADKYGKYIYEGDIISHNNRLHEVMINFNGYYLQRYKLWNGEFKPAFQYSMSLITKPSKDRFGGEVDSAEVVGNIYENPELLKS